MRMFAPLYLSNECINNCRYCGFSRDNPILRVTLTVEQVVAEAQHLAAQGFRHVLLVAGEHPKFVNESYLADCIRALRAAFFLDLARAWADGNDAIRAAGQAGAEGLVVYQETYNRRVYAEMHTSGPKRDFDWRLECPERAYAAGFRRIGIGALFGLAPWRPEARRSRRILNICLSIAGNRSSPLACRACVRRPENSFRRIRWAIANSRSSFVLSEFVFRMSELFSVRVSRRRCAMRWCR